MKKMLWKIISAKEKKLNGNWYVLCRCICGKENWVRKYVLGKRSFGCKKCCAVSIHGLAGSHVYGIYRAMVERCHNKTNRQYKDYGGRGIKVCLEWRKSPKAFLCWALKNGYSRKLNLDRRDNSGSYGPENCRFITAKENANNKRSNRIIAFKGNNYTMAELAIKLNMKYSVLKYRLNKGTFYAD